MFAIIRLGSCILIAFHALVYFSGAIKNFTLYTFFLPAWVKHLKLSLKSGISRCVENRAGKALNFQVQLKYLPPFRRDPID